MILKNYIKKHIKKYTKINAKYNSTKCNIKMYEYESAANPKLNKIPIEILENYNYNKNNESEIKIFDLSKKINTEYKATSPNLLASFINVKKNSNFVFKNHSSTNMFYVINGDGFLKYHDNIYDVSKGDIITIPFNENGISLKSNNNGLSLYHVDDSPLMNYLGVTPNKIIVPPTIYKKSDILSFMEKINSEDGAENRNRNGVLLGNTVTEKLGTKTLTNILWSLYNIIKSNSVQKPHKHNSVALDLCTYAAENKVYTLIGKELDENGKIINPEKVYWKTGCAFTTPPGYWHSHVNESNENAYVLPIQDAGLYTYQRTLDIKFVN